MPSNFDRELKPEITKQSSWLKSAASRCDALARKLQASGGKSDPQSSKDFLSPNKVADEVPNLRHSLEKENAAFSFRSPEGKTRQQEAARLLSALGE